MMVDVIYSQIIEDHDLQIVRESLFHSLEKLLGRR